MISNSFYTLRAHKDIKFRVILFPMLQDTVSMSCLVYIFMQQDKYNFTAGTEYIALEYPC